MTNLHKGWKEELLQFVNSELAQKLDLLKCQMTQIQESANTDTKSSAGDKYETGRAMAHLELEKFEQQVMQLRQSLDTLAKVRLDVQPEVIQFGSYVKTSEGEFFIGPPVGAITFRERCIFFISTVSPLAKQLIAKRVGDVVQVNDRTFSILQVS